MDKSFKCEWLLTDHFFFTSFALSVLLELQICHQSSGNFLKDLLLSQETVRDCNNFL